MHRLGWRFESFPTPEAFGLATLSRVDYVDMKNPDRALRAISAAVGAIGKASKCRSEQAGRSHLQVNVGYLRRRVSALNEIDDGLRGGGDS